VTLEKWEIDTVHSSIGFTVRHMVIAKVHGLFTRWTGTLELDTLNLRASRVEVKIDASSVDTRDGQRDSHLRSRDFFDVENYPLITFRSTSIEEAGDKKYRVRGDLTIRGITRELVLHASFGGQGKDPWGGQRVGFEATTRVERKEFGLQWNTALEAGGVLVGDTIDVSLEVEAKKAG
jgi:polyisoprenoid-binding protein YceI